MLDLVSRFLPGVRHQEVRESPILAIPNELVVMILSQLNASDLVRTSLTCKALCSVTDELLQDRKSWEEIITAHNIPIFPEKKIPPQIQSYFTGEYHLRHRSEVYKVMLMVFMKSTSESIHFRYISHSDRKVKFSLLVQKRHITLQKRKLFGKTKPEPIREFTICGHDRADPAAASDKRVSKYSQTTILENQVTRVGKYSFSSIHPFFNSEGIIRIVSEPDKLALLNSFEAKELVKHKKVEKALGLRKDF